MEEEGTQRVALRQRSHNRQYSSAPCPKALLYSTYCNRHYYKRPLSEDERTISATAKSALYLKMAGWVVSRASLATVITNSDIGYVSPAMVAPPRVNTAQFAVESRTRNCPLFFFVRAANTAARWTDPLVQHCVHSNASIPSPRHWHRIHTTANTGVQY